MKVGTRKVEEHRRSSHYEHAVGLACADMNSASSTAGGALGLSALVRLSLTVAPEGRLFVPSTLRSMKWLRVSPMGPLFLSLRSRVA